jgi:nucleoid-associated protein YgaU
VSETSTEQSTTRTGGGGLTKKMGPLPMWGWMAVVLVLVVLYAYYKKSKAASTTAPTSAAGGVNSPGGVDSSLVPQFINQTYTDVTPPAAPNVTVTQTDTGSSVPGPPGPAGPPGTPGKPGTPAPPDKEPTPPKTTVYTVKKGDTLSAIAATYHVKGGYPALAKLNRIANPNLIYPGQKITIPNG